MNEEPKESLTGYEIIVSVLKEWWDKMDDSVVLVRCKDCKCWDGRYCHNQWWGDGHVYYTPPIKTEDGYCDWAERKES